MKKLFLLLAMVGMLAVACTPGSVDDDNNGNSTEQSGGNNDNGGNVKPANDEIWYTSSDGNIVTPSKTDVFSANIVSNTYENGKGVIVFDAPVTSIGDYAFCYCKSLTSVTIPDSVTSIGHGAFEGCSSLTSVTIPDSVTSIGEYAFENCSGLTSVTIGNGVTAIGDGAFNGCTGELIINSKTLVEKDYTSSDSPTGSWVYGNNFTKLTIGDNITKIGNYAFYNCTSLPSVTIPDSVTSIGDSAFRDCSSLTSITIPDSVTSIGKRAFNYCSSLTAFYGKYASADNRCLVIDGALNSFAPAGLTEYIIPNGITSIGEAAFQNCSSLTSVTIGNSVTSIGEYAFHYCSSLTSVIIPDSVTSIGYKAFQSCSSLTSVYCKPTAPPVGTISMFYVNASYLKIYVPRNSVDAYKSAEGWKDYSSYIEGYDFE